jgi:hypothetical protein
MHTDTILDHELTVIPVERIGEVLPTPVASVFSWDFAIYEAGDPAFDSSRSAGGARRCSE